jgi:hypothetical protein
VRGKTTRNTLRAMLPPLPVASVFALTMPVALLATFVPISANGIGVREGLIVLLLVRAKHRARHGDCAEPLR